MISTAVVTGNTSPYQGFSMLGIRTTPKVLARETNGQFSMVEQVVEPGAESPHQTRSDETKIFYVAVGDFEFLLGTIIRRASAGDTITIPSGAAHHYRNVGTLPGTLLVTFTPGGHEEFLRELSELYQGEVVRPDDLDQVYRNYAVERI